MDIKPQKRVFGWKLKKNFFANSMDTILRRKESAGQTGKKFRERERERERDCGSVKGEGNKKGWGKQRDK